MPLYTSSPGDSSIGMNIAYHELMNGSRFMIDPNKDVNEVCAIVLAGKQNGCVILGGGSPKNFYLQAQPTLWEVYGIPKGGNDYFIQITTDRWSGAACPGATPAEAVSWGKVNPGVLPDTVVAYCDSTIAFPLFCDTPSDRRTAAARARNWCTSATQLVADLTREAKAAHEKRKSKVRSQKLKCKSSLLTSTFDFKFDGNAVLRAGAARGEADRRARASTPTRTCRPASWRTCASGCIGTCCSCSSTMTSAARRT